MVDLYRVAADVKRVLEPLGFKSLKIGLERGADKAVNCPLCRIVIEEEIARGALSDVVVQIVVGIDKKNDVEALYEEFFDFHARIKKALFALPYQIEILGTVMDEDRLSTIKAGIVRVKVRGLGAD